MNSTMTEEISAFITNSMAEEQRGFDESIVKAKPGTIKGADDFEEVSIIEELALQKKELESEAKLALESYRGLRQSIFEIDQQILFYMDSQKAEKVFLPDGSGMSIKKTTDREYNTGIMLSLKDKVPEALWNITYKPEINHKFKWIGVKKLLALGGEVRKLIEVAMLENTERKVVIMEGGK